MRKVGARALVFIVGRTGLRGFKRQLCLKAKIKADINLPISIGP